MEDTNKSIENLEEIINLINKELDKKDKNVSAILDLKDLLSLRNLIKAYKELEEENIQLEACKDEVIRRYNFESIPVSLVEERIEKLKRDDNSKKTKLYSNIVKFALTNHIGGLNAGMRIERHGIDKMQDLKLDVEYEPMFDSYIMRVHY